MWTNVAIENISDILLNIINLERRFDSVGDLGFDKSVSEKYLAQGYDYRPKTAKEAALRGQKHWNGLISSFPSINLYMSNGHTIVSADIAPTRYLIGQAYRDIWNETKKSGLDSFPSSPRMANVSLIAPVKHEGKYFILSQVKGKAIGSGQIHAAIVAGGVNANYLSETDPLTKTLQSECSEEIGLDLSYLNSGSFVFMIEEQNVGSVNFACVASNADFGVILSAYEAMTRAKLQKSEKLEVMALCELPVAGLALVPIEEGKGLKDVLCFKPSPDGLIAEHESRQVRPYTHAIVDYLAKPENARFLLQKAGF